MEALYIGAFIEKTGDSFPIPSPVLVHQLLQLFVFLLSPPALLESGSLLSSGVAIDLRYFLEHLINQIPVEVGGFLVVRGEVVHFSEVGDGGFASVILQSFEGFGGESKLIIVDGVGRA